MAELRAYNPSLRDQIAWAIAGGAEKLGAPPHRQRWVAEKVGGLVDFVPGLGEATGLDDAWRDAEAGNYGSAAANLGLTAIGAVPGVGDMAAGGLRKTASATANYLRDLGSEAPRLYRDMNSENALNFFQPGGLSGPFGQREMYWASDPSLARGQHGNTGVRFGMSGEGVMGQHDIKSKPGLEFVANTSGGKEYVTRDGVDFSKIDEVMVQPGVMFGGSPDDRLFLRNMQNLVDAGDFMSESPDGFATIFRRARK